MNDICEAETTFIGIDEQAMVCYATFTPTDNSLSLRACTGTETLAFGVASSAFFYTCFMSPYGSIAMMAALLPIIFFPKQLEYYRPCSGLDYIADSVGAEPENVKNTIEIGAGIVSAIAMSVGVYFIYQEESRINANKIRLDSILIFYKVLYDFQPVANVADHFHYYQEPFINYAWEALQNPMEGNNLIEV